MAKPILIEKIEEELERKPDIYYSTSEPTAGTGKEGDLWVIYEG